MNKKGFTFLELLIVLFIIAILSLTALINFDSRIFFDTSVGGKYKEVSYEVTGRVKLSGGGIRDKIDRKKFQNGINLLQKEYETKVLALVEESKL